MSFWTTVMSTPDVEVSLSTGIDQSQSANVSRMASTTSMADVVTNDHNIDIDMPEADDNSVVHVAKAPITTADTSAAVGEDVDMADAELPSTTHITDALEPIVHLQVPRFANLGLNARPLKFAGWKEPSPGLSVHTPIYTEDSPRRSNTASNRLPTVLVTRVGRPRRSSSYDGSGWTCLSWDPVLGLTKSMARDDDFVGYNDLPAVLTQKAQSAQPVEQAELDVAMEELAHNIETPYLDGKYFDLDSYLEYSQGTKAKSKLTPAPAKPTSRTNVVGSSTPKRGRTPPQLKLPAIAERDENAQLDRKVSSSPKTPSSGTRTPTAKAKDRYRSLHSIEMSTPTYHLSSRRSWQPIEDSYLLLFFEKVLSVARRGHKIRVLGATPFMEAFNDFFVGKALAAGLPVFEARGEVSIKGKLQTSVGNMKEARDETRVLLGSKMGGPLLYVPVITQEELEAFMEDGTVQVDHPHDEAKNAAKSPKC
ncbi:hypothetical protein IQ06DRAFT_362627 [Phaeosphaeriaceae sp. SRC1lsM3a]|nr:hypothetical protein IQ06DRAFT_362627 [Stagonospora sp. SRC1lsM3a]